MKQPTPEFPAHLTPEELESLDRYIDNLQLEVTFDETYIETIAGDKSHPWYSHKPKEKNG